jgi:hypothetical protein
MVSNVRSLLQTRMAVDSFAKLGMAHILLISEDQVACGALSQQMPDVGCVWDSSELNLAGDRVFELWHKR